MREPILTILYALWILEDDQGIRTFSISLCLNKKKKGKDSRCLDNGNFEAISILTFYRSLWKDGIYTCLRRFESWMWWMEHGSRIIRSILDFASTFQQIDARRREKELFSYSSLNIWKIKNPFCKDYYRSINFFFLLIWFFCKCSSCKCSLKKNLLSVILITRTNSFINLTIVFKTRFFEVGDQIDRKKLGKNIGIGIVNSEK